MAFLSIAILSVLVASIAVVAGLGGGVLLIPIIVLFYAEYTIQTVISSVLISLIIPAGIGAIGAYRRNEVDIKLALIFEIPTSIGAFLGARISSSIDEQIIKIIFTTLAVFLSIRMLMDYRSRTSEKSDENSVFRKLAYIKPVMKLTHEEDVYHISLPVLILAGLFIGFISGMLGVGGGWIKVPLLIIAFGVKPKVATGTSLFMIVITAAVGGYTHYLEGNMDPNLTLALVIGLGIGAFIGNKLKSKFTSEQVSLVVAVTLFIVAIALLL